MRRSDSKDAKQQNGSRTARSVWSARSLLPLWAARHRSKAPASWPHSIRFARQEIREALWACGQFRRSQGRQNGLKRRPNGSAASAYRARRYGPMLEEIAWRSVVVRLLFRCISVVFRLYARYLAVVDPLPPISACLWVGQRPQERHRATTLNSRLQPRGRFCFIR
jgi:hypothetical protein